MGKMLLLCALAAGCATSDADPKAGDASVTLAAVTLSDDCSPLPAPPIKTAQGSSTKPASPPATPPAAIEPPGYAPVARCAGPNCGGRSRCDQSSMQLAIKATAATTITIKKVELLDDKGKFLEELRSFRPTQWTAKDGKYVVWDEKASPSAQGNGELKVMYDLQSPNWGKLTNGRWNAHNKTFQLRVTIGVGTATKTVDKQSITPVMLPPPVPT